MDNFILKATPDVIKDVLGLSPQKTAETPAGSDEMTMTVSTGGKIQFNAPAPEKKERSGSDETKDLTTWELVGQVSHAIQSPDWLPDKVIRLNDVYPNEKYFTFYFGTEYIGTWDDYEYTYFVPDTQMLYRQAFEVNEDDTVTLVGDIEQVKFVAQVVGTLTSEEALAKSGGIRLVKSADGDYRWFAHYSNNFRDLENDILMGKAHKQFVALVEEGILPYPDLQLFHEKDWTIGKADALFIDASGDRVSVIATGTFDKGMEFLAKHLNENSDKLANSHGMPYAHRVSSNKNSAEYHIIDELITREISILPAGTEANPYTKTVLNSTRKEDKNMGIQYKREKLAEINVSPAMMQEVERLVDENRKWADASGADTKMLTKESDESEVAETEVVEVVESEETEVTEDSPITEARVTEIVAEALAENNKELAQVIATELGSLADQYKSLVADQQKAVEDAKESVSPQGLTALVAQQMSAVGKDHTSLDGRNSLAKDEPAEDSEFGFGEQGVNFANVGKYM